MGKSQMTNGLNYTSEMGKSQIAETSNPQVINGLTKYRNPKIRNNVKS